jgi:hypothetical protein
MTTDSLRAPLAPAEPGSIRASAPPRRIGALRSLSAALLAGAVPIDGGWVPPARGESRAATPSAATAEAAR